MIGDHYWSTGIEIKAHDGGLNWSASANFLDAGWCELESTEGVFRLRYLVDRSALPHHCQILKADMERLGIQFRVGEDVPAAVYVHGSEDPTNPDLPADWRDVAAAVADACGLDFRRAWSAQATSAGGDQ